MKTRPSRTKLKAKELTETPQASNKRLGVKLRRLNMGLMSKTEKVSKVKSSNIKPKADLLPDQQLEEELYYDFRPCCVKIRRLKSIMSPKNAKQTQGKDSATSTNPEGVFNTNHSRQRNSTEKNTTGRSQVQQSSEDQRARRCCVKIARLKPSSNEMSSSMLNASNDASETQIVKSTKIEKLHADTSKTRYNFRNPALSLTRRKTQKKVMVKPLTTDHDSRKDTEFNTANNCTTLPEASENATEPACTFSSQNDLESPEDNQDNLREKLCNTLSDISLPKNDNGKSHKVPSKKTSKQPLKASKTNQNTKSKNRGSTTKLSRRDSSKTADIYEFLSQSQTSGSESDKKKDPAADIIKKLIEKGNVAVTKNYKGKPIVVHRKRIKKKAIKQPLQGLQGNKKTALKQRIAFQPTHTVINEDEENVNFHEVSESPVENYEAIPLIPDAPKISKKPIKRNSNSSATATATANQGTFSSLARSVLMQQTNQTKSPHKNVFDRNRLLEITRRHFSTPLREPSAIVDAVTLSPIPITTPEKNITQRNESISNSANLENNASYRPSLTQIELNLSLSNENARSPRALQDAQQQSPLSSFSSNDSNAENMPPPPSAPPRITGSTLNDENALIFDARQMPNPRRTLPHRSPLKTINIIDVITLPPYRGHINTDKSDNLKGNEESQPNFDLDEYSNDDRSELCDDATNNNEETQALFGFEEYLDKEDESELDDEESINNSNNITSASLSNLQNKLKKLRKWRPNVPRHKNVKSSTITKRIFDDDFNKNEGNHDIRNMLCSTMVNAPSKNAENTTMASAIDSSDDSDTALPSTSQANAGVDLFGDPESTFNQNNLHRTYERPFKRKRKLQHQYSVALDSEDESEKEDEHNTSVKKKAKRHEKPRQPHGDENEELNKFVSEFNSMIKLAEEYELIVE